MFDSPIDSRAAAITLEGVHHAYEGVPSVKGINLDVYPGEVVCLLGPSGCGKTTALRIAAGLEPVTEGRVLIGGDEVSCVDRMVPPESRDVGLVFQDYALFPHLTIRKNIAFGLSKGVGTDDRIAEVLNIVGMADYADSYPHELSGGQQQRVALARALAPKPRAVLMDEPFSGLDARLRDSVRDETLHVLKASGTAVLMVTHDAEEAMHMADRIIVMRDGRVEQEGRPDYLYMKPANAFVAAFFGDVNRIPCTVSEGSVETPLGRFSAQDMGEGSSVEVVIRPEALALSEPKTIETAQVRVLASRMLGRTSLIHMCTCVSSDQEVHLHARVPGRYLPEDGALRSITLDHSQVFVFPVGDAT